MNKLTAIAAEMRRTAKPGKVIQRPLKRRLFLTLQAHADNRWTLSLTRQQKMPSEMEIKICCEAFGVSSDGTRDEVRFWPWYIVRLIWRDPAGVQERLL